METLGGVSLVIIAQNLSWVTASSGASGRVTAALWVTYWQNIFMLMNMVKPRTGLRS